MGMGTGQAAALAPDLGRAKLAMQSIFALLDKVCKIAFLFYRIAHDCCKHALELCSDPSQVPLIYGGSSFGKQPEEIKVASTSKL